MNGYYTELPVCMLDFTVNCLDGPPGNKAYYEIEMPLCLN
jgi:hypothetical protein